MLKRQPSDRPLPELDSVLQRIGKAHIMSRIGSSYLCPIIHMTYSQAPTILFCIFARLILSEGIELLY